MTKLEPEIRDEKPPSNQSDNGDDENIFIIIPM